MFITHNEVKEMKILSWKCNGKFREKYPQIIEESDTYIDADIYVICECEDLPFHLGYFYVNEKLIEKYSLHKMWGQD